MAVSDLALSWKDHHNVLISVFEKLLEKESLVDCTLAADGKFLKAHKVVLSACSPYLEALLNQENDKHPIIFLRDVEFEDLKTIVEFVYCGEIKIPENRLVEFLNLAEALQIKGLGSAENKALGTQPDSKPPPKRDAASPVPRKRLRCDSKGSESNSCDNKETTSLKPAHRGKDRVNNENQVLNVSGVDSSMCKTDEVIEEITLDVPQIKEEVIDSPVVTSSVRAEHSTVESVQCVGDESSDELADVKPQFEHVTFAEDYSDILSDSGATEESVINPIHSQPSTSHAYTGFSSEQIESGGLAEQTSNLSGDSEQPPSEGHVFMDQWPPSTAEKASYVRAGFSRGNIRRNEVSIRNPAASINQCLQPKKHHCNLCLKSFRSAFNYRRHVSSHSGDKPFQCTFCSEKFGRKERLDVHIRTHTGERPFKCSYCLRNFNESGSLTRHLRIHTGEKPFQCTFCSARFSQSGTLKNHLRVHGRNS